MTTYYLPPGVFYITQLIPRLAVILLPVFILQSSLYEAAPIYVWTFAYVLAIPATIAFKRTTRHLWEEREIKRLGARRVPTVRSRWPGGIDTMRDIVKSTSLGYPGDYWANFCREYGPTLNIRVLWEDVIATTEPQNIKTILSSEFNNYEKGKKFRWYMQSVLGSGVFNSDGDMWKFHRGISRPFFVRDRVTDFELFNRKAELVVSQLKARFSEGEAVDFQDVMGRFTLDSATQFLFGSCVHSLSAKLPYAHNSPRLRISTRSHASDEFVTAFTQALNQIALRTQYAESWPLTEFWKDKTKDPMKVIDAYIDPILRDALFKKGTAKRSSEVGSDDAEAETLLDHLVEETDDHVILKDAILNIMIAGRDTTMATLTFAVYCLSQYPDILAKLRQEIFNHIGPNSAPSFEVLRQCKYLRAVINETLRLYPAVPFNVRTCKRSTIWGAPDGGKPYYIPAGVQVSYSVWLMRRRKDLWGADADEFDPDRFLDERRDKYLSPNPFIFLPFNAGPRICLGQQFAYNETSFMLVRLLQAFDTITLTPDAQPLVSHPSPTWKSEQGRQAKEKVWPKTHLTLHSFHGLWLKMGTHAAKGST